MPRQIFSRIVVAARGVNKNALVRFPVAVAFGQQFKQRLSCDLGNGIPHRHVDRSDGDRAFAMSARLLVGHHASPNFRGVEIFAARIDEAGRFGFEYPRPKPFTNQAALAISSVGIESVSHHRLAVADYVGYDRDQAQRHLREIDIRVADRRSDRLGDLAHIHNPHARSPVSPARAGISTNVANSASLATP